MAFRPPKKPPEFADLKIVLAQTRDTEDPLYQVVQEIIERLSAFKFEPTETIVVSGGGGGGGGGANPNATYLTKNDETSLLPNALQFLARYGLKFDDTVVNRRTIDLDLEYLGNFAAGPLYSDGDVVVGPDNIAYLCVRPTNDPPVMWPGVGMASAVGPPGPQGIQGPPGPPGTEAVDATYWLVNSYSGLPNARPLAPHGVGYVRSTAGEPSVVATIPLTDTTGILPDNRLTSNVALKNIDNGFVAQTFASYSIIRGQNSALYFTDTAAPVDAQIWRLLNYSNGNLYLEALNSAGNAIQSQIAFTRDSGIHGNGYGITNLNASNLSHGLANPARLGNGTANSGTYLRGDSTWQPITVPDPFPSGLIVISMSPCPPGWTRANWDGYFIRSGPSPGATGGSSSHSHDEGNLQAENHDHGGETGNVNISISVGGNTSYDGDHHHRFTDSFSGTTGGENSPPTYAEGGTAVARYNHTHNFSGEVDNDTNTAGEHSHSFSGSGSDSARGSIADSGNLGVFGETGASSNLPPFLDVYFCQKD